MAVKERRATLGRAADPMAQMGFLVDQTITVIAEPVTGGNQSESVESGENEFLPFRIR